MHKLSLNDALEQGWSHFKRRGWYLFGVTATIIGLFLLVSGETAATALAYIIFAGYLGLLFKHARQEEVTFDDLFDIDRRWIYFAFVSVIKGVFVMLGLLLFIIPGIYLAIRWMFAEYYVIDKGMRPIEAMKASSELTAGYRWKLFGYMLLAIFIAFLGLLCFGIGLFAAIAILNLTTIAIFWRLQEIQYLNQQEPKE